MKFNGVCPVCGGSLFSSHKVLWLELIDAWELNPQEVEYINRQQGYVCDACGNNLRSMSIASAILKRYKFVGTLLDFAKNNKFNSLKIL